MRRYCCYRVEPETSHHAETWYFGTLAECRRAFAEFLTANRNFITPENRREAKRGQVRRYVIGGGSSPLVIAAIEEDSTCEVCGRSGNAAKRCTVEEIALARDEEVRDER